MLILQLIKINQVERACINKINGNGCAVTAQTRLSRTQREKYCMQGIHCLDREEENKKRNIANSF
jgi:hypothetical protein